MLCMLSTAKMLAIASFLLPLIDRFYVGCDDCEGWFHPTCVGITQEEAEASDTYVCPTCRSKGSNPSNHVLPVKGHVVVALKKLVKSLQVLTLLGVSRE